MRFDVVTIFPEMLRAITESGVTRRAVERGLIEIAPQDPRDYTTDRHRTVDDRPYGGGPGMVMKVQPLRDAIHAARSAVPTPATVVYLSPQGRPLDQATVSELARLPRLILLCGRYEGVDERLIAAEVDREISVGDFVVSGGELPAMMLIDAVSRLVPGVLGHVDSAEEDSFTAGLLDCPHYTRPESIDGRDVPAVLLGGDHQAVARWRRKQALGRTWLRRPELLSGRELDGDAQALLEEFIEEYRGDSER
ncbi:tRNA (guanine-N(1)-)-methyltransferase [wastewater metagenome]|uniref:tRNA (guanine-N(1)-)-methyltransferase n=2 Tax=unclassified sequences TaxID=12908 RepID=A0A5B8RBM8_9ZZZZ|nr:MULTISPECIES: tRNA (guanosine(37)-N1)-methyltransferase TrmD [Arhodomonas]MCS4504558.1 tRNA (guanosine(37)-N1)-methyltransferase TrmD [Arhodomonas aquaeolei]QEA05483.1 tRNA (guanine-N(1)-)-methyltransferase [uncultured organism]